jgi:hypothetical protein
MSAFQQPVTTKDQSTATSNSIPSSFILSIAQKCHQPWTSWRMCCRQQINVTNPGQAGGCVGTIYAPSPLSSGRGADALFLGVNFKNSDNAFLVFIPKVVPLDQETFGAIGDAMLGAKKKRGLRLQALRNKSPAPSLPSSSHHAIHCA